VPPTAIGRLEIPGLRSVAEMKARHDAAGL
jgi:hypothetical protein